MIIFSHVRTFLANNEDVNLQFFGSNIILIPIISSVAIIGFISLYKKNIPAETTPIFNVMTIVVILFVGSQITIYFINDDSQISSFSEFVEIPITQSEIVDKPDVYLIVLDAYSGDIVLEEDYDFDNSKYKNELRDRGFFVQNPSYSNYPNTEASLPSIMNMVYLDSINETVGKNSDDKKVLIELRQGNNVMDVFDKNGYHITNFYGGASVSPSNDPDYETICGIGYLNMSEDLQRSIVQTYFSLTFLRTVLFDNFRHHDIECAWNEVVKFEKKNEKPQYLHIHMYLPHPPLIYDSEGNKIQNTFSYNRFDPSLRDAYLEQTIYTNKITIEMIDSIQQKDDSAVIIVMSDHGGRLGVNWETPTVMDYYRTFNTMSAFYFPGHENEIPEEIAAVNTFRVFFNTYFNTDYEILEDRQMWYTPEQPYDQTDVTEKLSRK